MKKRVLVIYTGGTIGMVPGEHGYAPGEHSFLERLQAIPDLYYDDCPAWELEEFSPLLDSSDIWVGEWNKIGGAIARRYDEFDGFVVLHGTDTMAYSASALSFMLENLEKPVIFTGAQIPLCAMRSDGRNNIVTAMMIAASGMVREVCLYFHGCLLRGNRSTKHSSEQMEAFESPNAPPLAEAGISVRLVGGQSVPVPAGLFRLQELSEVPVGVIKVFPGIQFELFESMMTDKLKGIVLETFGSGNIPSARSALLPVIEKARRGGSIIVVRSQCARGAVSIGAYAAGKALRDIGAVDGKDMTTEAAVTKLCYLFSKGFPQEKIKLLMSKNLRGELSE